jgi:hypothetical protein
MEGDEMTRTQWDGPRVNRELSRVIKDVLKSSGCSLTTATVEYVTPPERAEALSKAFEYRQMAERLTDGASADSYRALAKKTLQEAGLA